ncbi:MAG: crotonase [Microbacterium sp. 71-36]|uniref:enoyl-CoA hydratase/isomerase family protein n=1 Tax=unclassified Microbacterium TaxID=2609290 RepID=UPI00086D71FF|nr:MULTISPECIES: enoyl-CoA hydratase-related protein [unclassified Microbacterium]MBN9212733.1 enoyl-CoA hydratase/isomerase family protein [Microbacterium sp.]ODT41607.1 MAG: crotonase [Microbacterium sp. SCN 71-17]ODU49902.1 MAG: crotonase [Microbacterium sp. SCN 70-10]OJV77550.1 MAG: crotonase [Microbacterium sp. 71-36]
MIAYGFADDVAEIVLDAPQRRNALGLADLHDLAAAFARAEEDGARAVLLRGEGKAFCAGRDIAGVDPATDDVSGYLDGALEPLLHRIAAFPAPTFAVAHGACLGVGLGLLVATDVVYVAEDARIGSPFAALGATLDSGGHALFAERLGIHATLDLVYTGRMLTGAEAVRAGLFSRVVPADEVRDATMSAAQRAAAGPTAAFVASKRLLARWRDERLGLWDVVAAETRAQTALAATDDYREGFAAFQAKRPPEFLGR